MTQHIGLDIALEYFCTCPQDQETPRRLGQEGFRFMGKQSSARAANEFQIPKKWYAST